MKLAFMSFSAVNMSAAELADEAKRLGYEGVEPRLSANHAHGIENGISKQAADEFKKIFSDRGVAICCLATSCGFSDPKTINNNIDSAKQTIDLAVMLGVKRIRVFGGIIPEGVTREEAVQSVTGAFITLADYIGSEDVVLCMETHDSWCDPDDVANVIKSVSRNSIMVNWDLMHPVMTAKKTMKEAFDVLKPWIKHVHAHDGIAEGDKRSLVPIGQGQVDHKTALSLLKEAGYKDYISGEWIASGNMEFENNHLEREFGLLKRLL